SSDAERVLVYRSRRCLLLNRNLRPMSDEKALLDRLERLAAALERMAPPAAVRADFERAEAFVWQADPVAFIPVAHVNRQPLALLKGIERAADQLLDNTRRFAEGLP